MSTDALRQKLSSAKTALVVDNPFIASLLCSLKVTWDDKLLPPTMTTDSHVLTVRPEHIEKLSPPNVRFALANTTLKLVFNTFLPERIGQRDPVKWDIACDVVCNALLLKERKDGRSTVGEMWEGAIHDQALFERGGRTIEGVYALLPDPTPEQIEHRQGVIIFEGSEAEQSEAAARMHVRVAQARDIAKAAGSLSDSMAQFVGEELTPKVRWQDVLRSFFNQRVAKELTWARPSRRGLAQGMLRPGKDGQGMGDALVAVDLSGSTTNEERQEYFAELRALKADCQPTNVHVIYFTGSVTGYDCFGQDDDLVLRPRGSGGTRFSPIFRYCQEHDIDPACAVVLTDLECSDFGPTPAYPVLWVSTASRGPVPFGEVIMLRETSL